MARRIAFIISVFLFLAGLAFASRSARQGHELRGTREEVLAYLDSIVAKEHAYFLQNGYYTPLLSRLNLSVPRTLVSKYEFRITETGPNRVRVSAFTEEKGKVIEEVSVDQDYQVVTPAVHVERKTASVTENGLNVEHIESELPLEIEPIPPMRN